MFPTFLKVIIFVTLINILQVYLSSFCISKNSHSIEMIFLVHLFAIKSEEDRLVSSIKSVSSGFNYIFNIIIQAKDVVFEGSDFSGETSLLDLFQEFKIISNKAQTIQICVSVLDVDVKVRN